MKLKSMPDIRSIEKELAERSLHEYIKQAWDILEPATDYVDNWHIECMAEHLEAVNLGQIKRLLINVPPRSMKSISCTIMFPTWVWIHHPHRRFIACSYADSLSRKHNMEKRDIIRSPWYQRNWGDRFDIKEDKDRQNEFANNRTGFMFSTSVGGTLTGNGADIIICDDLQNVRDAESDASRLHALNFFRMTLPTRLNNKKTGAIIVVMQRLHEEDVSGFILREGLGYTHLNLPAIAEDRQVISFPISLKEIVREEGDVLNPGRENLGELNQLRKELGEYAFAGQYQQIPSPSAGGIYKKHWWKFWKPYGKNLPPIQVKVPYEGDDGQIKFKSILVDAEELPNNLEESQSWDCSFKDTKGSDFVAGGVWGNSGADHYLLSLVEERLSFTDTLAKIIEITKLFPLTGKKLVEDKANGSAIIDTLRRTINGIIPFNPGKDSKESRAKAVAFMVEAGNVYLPHPSIAPWVEGFIDRCSKFPNVKHDDIIDQMTQYLLYSTRCVKSKVRVRGGRR